MGLPLLNCALSKSLSAIRATKNVVQYVVSKPLATAALAARIALSFRLQDRTERRKGKKGRPSRNPNAQNGN
jgi:hypothetical protein